MWAVSLISKRLAENWYVWTKYISFRASVRAELKLVKYGEWSAPIKKMHQKFCSRDFPGVVLQKETLVQHQMYTWLLLIGLEYFVGINLPRGDTIFIMHCIYTAEGHRNSFMTPHRKKQSIKTFHLPTLLKQEESLKKTNNL